jgi:hypothetical protein
MYKRSNSTLCQEEDIPLWNDGPHIKYELTVEQLVEKMRNGSAEHEYNLIAVTELVDCGFWIEESQYDLIYTLSPAAMRIYLSIEHGVFTYNETLNNRLGLTKEEYDQGIVDLVASGTVAFRLTSPMYGDMAGDLLQRAWECMGDMEGILTKYMKDDGRDYTSKEVAISLFNSMPEQDRQRYIELDKQRVKLCTDSQLMLTRQSEELTGNVAPQETDIISGNGMRPLGPYASGFVPNVKIIDATPNTHSQSHNYISNQKTFSASPAPHSDLPKQYDTNMSDTNVELISCTQEINETDAGLVCTQTETASYRYVSKYVSKLVQTSDKDTSSVSTEIGPQKRYINATTTPQQRYINATLTLHPRYNNATLSRSAIQRLKAKLRIEFERLQAIDFMDGSGSPNAYNSPFAIRRSQQVPEVQAAYSRRHPSLSPLTESMAKRYLSYRDNSILSVIAGMEECDRYLASVQRENGHSYATYYRDTFRGQCRDVKQADKESGAGIVDSTLA